MRAAAALLVSLSVAACEAAGPAGPVPAEAPLVGRADAAGTDLADRDCRVALEGIERQADGTWAGTVLVDAWAPAEAIPRVLYRPGPAGGPWFQVEAVATGEVEGGFSRHAFEIEPTDTLDFIPFAAAGQVRWFDHNRIWDPLGSYHTQGTRSIDRDPSMCDAVVRFERDWSETVNRAVVRGRRLVVSYDPERLTACRGTHNGYPAWDLRAHVLFAPGGEHVDGTLKSHHTDHGYPLPQFDPVPFTTAIPEAATSAEVWVHNTGLWGCSAYDSDFGRNYRFVIRSTAY
ncbi:MAG TPA: DUF6209 family protein [Kofleriaceae bacterium]|nr:DUF6209 family protein [Kofleriaceae bacterium]